MVNEKREKRQDRSETLTNSRGKGCSIETKTNQKTKAKESKTMEKLKHQIPNSRRVHSWFCFVLFYFAAVTFFYFH